MIFQNREYYKVNRSAVWNGFPEWIIVPYLLFVYSPIIIGAVACCYEIRSDMQYFSGFGHHGPWYNDLSTIYSDSIRKEYAATIQNV